MEPPSTEARGTPNGWLVLCETVISPNTALERADLYASLLATRRKERAAGITEAMSPHKRGPMSAAK